MKIPDLRLYDHAQTMIMQYVIILYIKSIVGCCQLQHVILGIVNVNVGSTSCNSYLEQEIASNE